MSASTDPTTAPSPSTSSPAGADERLVDVGRGITLCAQTLGDPADPPLLLIAGLGQQLVSWPDAFCELLVARGLQVIR